MPKQHQQLINDYDSDGPIYFILGLDAIIVPMT